MTNHLFKTFLLLSVLLLASCTKENIKNNNNGGTNTEKSIPKDFTFKTITDVTITINVQSISGVSDNLFHIIKVYSNPMMSDNYVVASGVAKPGFPFVTTFSIPNGTTKLYVKQYKPNGLVANRVIDITSNQLTVNLLTNETKGELFNAANSSPSPAISVPQNFDVIVNNNSALTLTGFASGESSAYGNAYKSYYIPEGYTRTTSIDFGNWLSHSIIYVKGTLDLSSSSINLNLSSIVVLTGGTVKVKSLSTGSSTQGVISIYVQPGGHFVSSGDINLSNSKDFVNFGVFECSGDMDINNGSSFYNEGTLSVLNNKKQRYLHVTNNAYLYNSSSINTAKCNITTNGVVTNEAGATITASYWYQTNSTTFNNNGEAQFFVEFKTSGGGTINNACMLTTSLLDIQGSQFYLGSGSFINAVDVKASQVRMNMSGGSMVMATDLSSIYDFDVTSTSQDYSLIKFIGDVADMRYSASEFNGKIEFVHSNLTDGSGANGRERYEALFNNNGSILSKDQSQNIVATSCNGGEGAIAPTTPEIIDNDGDGVPAEYDIDDNDPTIALASHFPSENSWGTYAYEDLWPWKGDYDMNDLVITFRVTYYTNTSNQISAIKFDYNLVAMGSTQDIAAAIQLDKINSSAVSSVTGQKGGSAPFAISSNGTESGATLAIIPLFNNGIDAVPGMNGFLNTQKGKHLETANHSVIIRFSSPQLAQDVTINNFNFFIVANSKGKTLRGKEIHMPGYRATSKADPSIASGAQLFIGDNYKFTDGMMWGLMIPDNFQYPSEGKDLSSTYINFMNWALSGGASFTDWYTQQNGYVVEENLYTF